MRMKNNCSRFLFKLTSELFIPKIFEVLRSRCGHDFRILIDFGLFWTETLKDEVRPLSTFVRRQPSSSYDT